MGALGPLRLTSSCKRLKPFDSGARWRPQFFSQHDTVYKQSQHTVVVYQSLCVATKLGARAENTKVVVPGLPEEGGRAEHARQRLQCDDSELVGTPRRDLTHPSCASC
eukprot:4250402-Pleurochrysis_carterae.AAC.1